ncbi:MAG TPA: carboxypeptidase-like regulatory domain-containing protein [Vicinamibacterales bacterium]
MRRLLLLTLLLSGTALADTAAQAVGQIIGRPPGRPGMMRPPRDRGATLETGTARLRGVVVGGESGQPLRRAIVRLQGEGIREGRITTTDEEGRWELADLPAGRYTLTASKAGYVTLQYGQRRAFVAGRPIELADGQTLDNLNFHLPRGAVISGRIIDEFGEPVADVSVAPMRYQFANGRRQLVPAGRFAQTDDGGHFRIYGLPPGEFYLSATFRDWSTMGAMNESSHGYAPTYYPGVMSPQHAEPIVLGLGGEVSGLTFPLLPVRTVTISGTALDGLGRPLANAFVQVMPRENVMGVFTMSAGNRTREDGSFRVTNVVPGDYTVIAVPIQQIRGGGENIAPAMADVTVGSEDISGVVLTPPRGATIRGRVVLKDRASNPPSPETITITALPDGDGGPVFMMGTRPSALRPDWTFDLRVPRSPALIRPLVTSEEWTVAAVLVNGEDVADTGVTFRDGDMITDVQVVLTTRRTEVSGSVVDDRGQPAPDYTVVVFPEDPAYWRARWSRRIRVARPDQSGTWSIRGLPPGRYVATAIEAVEQGEEYDSALLERLRPIGTPFALGEGGQQTMRLTLQQVY